MVGILNSLKSDIARALEERRISEEAEETAKQERIAKIVADIEREVEAAMLKVKDADKIRLELGKTDYLLLKIPITAGAKNPDIVAAMRNVKSAENASCDDYDILLETDSDNMNVKLFKKQIEGGELN